MTESHIGVPATVYTRDGAEIRGIIIREDY